MQLPRRVTLREGLRYRGQGPMLAFVLHRLSGLGMVLFVSMHILAAWLTSRPGSTEVGIAINAFYESHLLQAFLFFCALFHAINGLRIVILDFWPRLLEYQREAIWLEWAVFLPVYALALWVILNSGSGGAG